MGTRSTEGMAEPPSSTSTHGRRPFVVDTLIRQAQEREEAAEERDARALTIADELAADPESHTAAEVSALASADRAAAAADRAAAAEERDTLLRLVLGEGYRQTVVAPVVGLTVREAQVLERLAKAMTTKAIADDLFLSPNSIKTHTQSLYRKIGVTSRSEAALWARDHGIG
jgi:DNA-binding CsgD family transcriptional regulator